MPKIEYGVEGVHLTWQAKFPETASCVKCGKTARLAIVVQEGSKEEDYACNLHQNNNHPDRPEGEGFWLHDAAAFATYLCVDIHCATATTLWNQG